MTDVLAPSAEIALARRIEAGVYAAALLADPALPRPAVATDAELARVAEDGCAAQREFVAANLGLVAWEARRWGLREGLDIDELVQEGSIGLVHAVERWDHTQGRRFAAYAIHWVRKQVRLACANRCGQLPVSQRAGLAIRRGLRDPVARQHAAALVAARSIFDPEEGLLPIAASPTGGDDPLVRRALAVLDAQQRAVVTLRMGWAGEPMSQRDVAARVGVPRRRVAVLEQAALRRMRAALAETDQVA